MSLVKAFKKFLKFRSQQFCCSKRNSSLTALAFLMNFASSHSEYTQTELYVHTHKTWRIWKYLWRIDWLLDMIDVINAMGEWPKEGKMGKNSCLPAVYNYNSINRIIPSLPSAVERHMLRRETLHARHIKLVICNFKQQRCKQKLEKKTRGSGERIENYDDDVSLQCAVFAQLDESMCIFMEIFSCFNYMREHFEMSLITNEPRTTKNG